MIFNFRNKYGLVISIAFLILILENTRTFDFIMPSGVIRIFILGFVLVLGIHYNNSIELTTSSFILLMLLAMIFTYAIISSVWALYPRLTAQRALLAFIPPIILFLIVTIDNQRKSTFYLLTQIVAIFGSVFALIGVSLYLFGNTGSTGNTIIQYIAIGPLEISQEVYGRGRIGSILGNPNSLAAFLIASIPLSLIMYLDSQHKLINALGITIQFSALILTGSRIGGVAIICGLGVILFLLVLNKSDLVENLIKSKTKILASVTVLVTLVPVVIPTLTNQRIFNVSPDVLGESTRFEMWSSLWHYSIANPQGTGFGISQEVLIDLQSNPHSDYFAFFGELGVIGIVLFGLTIGTTVWYSLKKYIHAPVDDRLYLMGAIAVFIGFTAHGFAETTIARGNIRQMFWIFSMAHIACYSYTVEYIEQK